MADLSKLIQSCRASVNVTVNDHRSIYETALQYLGERQERDGGDLADEAIIKEMIARDTIIELQFYPDTPNGFHTVFHWDFDKAVEEALAIIDEWRS